ncbi:Bicyclomycin resistance protein [Vibrio aerogenes CECT 7868]|uniref:Bcr/CflA family efflux transporter n=1 Tax=Vibrio aerogenes CECT 7868 TaxID=1216006 RepID=A0A1M6DX29_9VIBR|nr:Bcr/CflA family multidrug efflux MFS transporter [Vibrio aerogenes]SHI77679.1 Bicyclomycin resistance protein [Vibrio aerogenes CECT 7868]
MSEKQHANAEQAPSVSLLLLIILGAIGAVTPLAIDMYLPAMPVIAQNLGVSDGLVQMTLTAYMAGFAIGQLLHGPLSDTFGRKPVMLIGLILFSVGAFICATVTSIEALSWVRAAQGFAGAAAAVVIQAVVRDMFEREDFARVMSFITIVIIIAPLIAPVLGGNLAVWFGWRSIFWFLVIFSIIVIGMVIWLIPETLSAENRQSFHVLNILKNYAELCRSARVLGLIFCGAFSFSGLFSFLTAGSFVYVNIFGVSPDMFGYLFGLNILTMMGMTTLNSRLVKRLGSRFMLHFGLTVQLISGCGLFLCWLLDSGLWGIVPCVMFYIGSISTIGSNSMGLLMSHYPRMAGTASSLAGTLRFGTGAGIGAIVASLPSGEVWPMLISMALCSVAACVFYWILGRK